MLSDLIGLGGQLGGTFLGMHQQGKNLAEQQREFDLNRGDRNQRLRLALPGMLTNLGYSQGAIPRMMGDPNMTPQYHAAPPQSPGGGPGVGSILGMVAPSVAGFLLPKILGGGRGAPTGRSWSSLMPEFDNG